MVLMPRPKRDGVVMELNRHIQTYKAARSSK